VLLSGRASSPLKDVGVVGTIGGNCGNWVEATEVGGKLGISGALGGGVLIEVIAVARPRAGGPRFRSPVPIRGRKPSPRGLG
jgi:hypothetical protein